MYRSAASTGKGKCATLIASGFSRVVADGAVFQTLFALCDPTRIAFTPIGNAIGLPDVGMVLPFESTGVDTSPELQLLKAANPLNRQPYCRRAVHRGMDGASARTAQCIEATIRTCAY